MLNFGFGEIALIMVLAIVVVGPDRLPEMLQFLGKQYGKVMRASNDLKRAFMLEADRAEAEKRAELLRERREQARVRAQEAGKSPPRAPARRRGRTNPQHPVARSSMRNATRPPIHARTVANNPFHRRSPTRRVRRMTARGRHDH